jgi:GNAT superfamily N-acetyltransferase
MEKFIIRQGITKDYTDALYNDAFYEIKHDRAFYADCAAACQEGARAFFVVYDGAVLAGHIQLNYQSRFAFFKHQGIPEIQDLNVRRDYRGLGLGRLLIAKCEEDARQKAYPRLGLAVGLHHRYGPAQILYSKLGYRPTGEGVLYDYEVMPPLTMKPLDDHFVLTMVKGL